MKSLNFLLMVMLFISSQLLNAKVLNDSIPPGKNYEKAAFRLWYSDDIETIHGILVIVPGSNGDGRIQISDTIWQLFAQKHGLAILACYYKDYESSDSFIERYVNVSQGSGQALLKVIRKFSRTSGHHELENSPLLLWGASAGGQFNYEFACWCPEKVIGFIVNKGGIYYTALAPKATRSVPGIFFIGEKDLEARNDIIKGLFSMNRRAGALWIYAPEPGVAHEFVHSKILALIFFNEILSLRSSGDLQSDKKRTLVALKESDGWIGDHKSQIILPASEIKKYDYPVSWFPGRITAEAWKIFISK